MGRIRTSLIFSLLFSLSWACAQRPGKVRHDTLDQARASELRYLLSLNLSELDEHLKAKSEQDRSRLLHIARLLLWSGRPEVDEPQLGFARMAVADAVAGFGEDTVVLINQSLRSKDYFLRGWGLLAASKMIDHDPKWARRFCSLHAGYAKDGDSFIRGQADKLETACEAAKLRAVQPE